LARTDILVKSGCSPRFDRDDKKRISYSPRMTMLKREKMGYLHLAEGRMREGGKFSINREVDGLIRGGYEAR